MSLNSQNVRAAFPFFAEHHDLAYLDNSATSQVPECVLSRVRQYELMDKASPFRGLYHLSVKATDDYENARAAVACFIHAANPCEIIFTRNASESLNLVAYSLGQLLIHEGDEILVGITEHHSNFIPWQQLAARTGAKVRYLLCDKEGRYQEQDLIAALTPKTKILAITHMSNIFGRINDLKRFTEIAHQNGTLVVGDGCQSTPHIPVDVSDLDVDFYAFSGHKMMAPTGIGVLYGKEALLKEMPPFLTGGEMIDSVTTEGAVWAPLPQKFEAGTVNTGGALGLHAAIDFYDQIGFDQMMAREHVLTERLMTGMLNVPHVHILGDPSPDNHHGIVAFTVDGVHPHDVSAIMSDNGVAIRAGHHCAQPLHIHLGINASSRASLMFYNTEAEVDRFLEILSELRGAMGYAD